MRFAAALPPREGLMTDNQTADGNSVIHPARMPFPFVRVLYALGYGIVAWFVIHLVFLLAVAQFVVVVVTGHVNEELKRFSFSLVQYLWELLAFVAFVRDEQPFPIGPFPTHV
jgi:hypothetical protein